MPKYAQSKLARLRAALNLTQPEAAAKLGLSHKQMLSDIETGGRQASVAVMKKMVAAGWGTPRQVLEACTHTFEHGVLMRKHRARQRTLTRRTVPQTALA